MEDDGCGLPTGENWMENRRRFLGGVAGRAAALPPLLRPHGWVLSLTPRGAGSGTRAEVRIPLAGTMFPIEGSVELHTIHPALTTADGLRWQILRELACCPIKWNDTMFSALLRAFPGQAFLCKNHSE